jgi:tetratricopeptide (TPR) repeat protein
MNLKSLFKVLIRTFLLLFIVRLCYIEYWKKQAEYYLSNGISLTTNSSDYLRAIADFNRAVQINNNELKNTIRPDEAKLYSWRAGNLYQVGDYKGAIQDYISAINASQVLPDTEDNAYFRDRLESDLIDTIIKMNPQGATAYYKKARTLYLEGNYQGAITELNKVIKINAEYPNKFNEIINIPRYQSAYSLRGLNHSLLGDYQSAIMDYTEAIKIYPNDEISYCNRGFNLLDSGNIEGANLDYKRYISIKSTKKYKSVYTSSEDSYVVNRGRIRYNSGDTKGAIEDFSEAIETNPNHAKLYAYRSSARNESGDTQGAIEDFNQAIKIEPNNSSYYAARGKIRNESGDKKGAIEDFSKAIKIEPSEAIYSYYNYYNRGSSRYDIGDKKGAINDFNKARSMQGKGENKWC